MSISEKIDFEIEIQENVSVAELKDEYKDGVCIWISGSGGSPESPSRYRIVLEYKGHTQYMEKDIPDKTANQVMILGAIDAVKRITKPIRIYLIAPTMLGLESGLRGKGPNSQYIQELFSAVVDRDCRLTEVRFLNGSSGIKRYILQSNPDKVALNRLEKDENEKQLRYKRIIYRECIDKVIQVLHESNVNSRVIEKVKEICP